MQELGSYCAKTYVRGHGMRSSEEHDNEPLCWSYVALVSDKHIVEPGQRLGLDDTIERAQALVNAISQDGVAPNLVVHLGDVAVALGAFASCVCSPVSHRRSDAL